MSRRFLPPYARVLLNACGGGKIQVNKFLMPHQAYYDAIRIPPHNELLALIRKRRGGLIMGKGQVWIRKGVSNAASLTFAGTGNDWQFVDGLDITAEFTSDEAIADFGVAILASATAATLYFALEIDGAVRPEWSIEANKTTGVGQFNGATSVHCGSGVHRIRLMVTASAIVTVDFKSQARYLRILNLAGD